MPWVKLDDDFHAHPKVLQAGPAATGLYVMALTYCAHYLTDGEVPSEWVAGIPSGGKLAARLVEVGLWTQNGSSNYAVPDYLEFQPSRYEVEKQRAELSATRSKAGRKGAKARWQN